MSRPVPVVLARLHGNPGKRALPKHAREPAGNLQDPPDWLSASQKSLWWDLVETSPPGLLTESHRNLVAGLVASIDLHRQAVQAIEAEGAMVTTPNGHRVQNAWVPVANKQIAIAQRLSAELGLTPTSATRVTLKQTAAPRELGRDGKPRMSLDEYLLSAPTIPTWSGGDPKPKKAR